MGTAGQIIDEYDDLFKQLKAFFPNYRKNRLLVSFKPKGETFKVRFIVYSFILLERTGLARPFLRAYSRV